jgi:predicted RNA-binding protein with RPS1 domain
MSDQELTVVEEATETEVEERPAPASSESSPDVATEVVSEVSPSPADSPANIQAEEALPASVAGEAEPTSETAGEPETDDGLSIHNLKPRRHLVGKVKNITNFGAFVDIGLPQDGLVHISELSRRKVEKVTDVVDVGQEIDVWVKKVDKKRGRISLTMVKPVLRRLRDIKEDDELEGTVTRLESYGAFVDIDSDREGLVHISQITHDYINHPEEALAIGDKVTVKVLKVNKKKRQVDLSIKVLLPPPVPEEPEVIEEAPVQEPVVEEVAEDEPTPTAMALAYAAFQGDSEPIPARDKALRKGKRKRKREMDAIIERTLAARE